jgi:DNA (cytosine-5)-methyltransferase 1
MKQLLTTNMRHGSLFSGIGGFDLAAEWMGWENIFHCEWNEFGQKVLKHHFPNSISYNDITQTDFTIHRGRIDILTGGFPCQPYSSAGKRLGKEDNRHLFPEMLRAIREIQPTWVVGENVFGLVNWSGGLVFHEVQIDLEAEGYEVQPYVLPACSVNAPHRRDRVWFVAYRNFSTKGSSGKSGEIKSNGSKNNDEQKGWGIKGKFDIGRSNVLRFAANTNIPSTKYKIQTGWHLSTSNDNSRITTDTESESSQRMQFKQPKISESEKGKLGGNSSKLGSKPNASDTSSWGVQRYGRESSNGKFQANEFDKNNCSRKQPMDWREFPTQSPICSRNDGVSYRLDNITFSKWRNESIKAYGNAVVPQVVFQIFKSIEQFKSLYL